MADRHNAAAVILAAGASTRFGSPKQLAPFGRGTMLERVVDVARAAGLAPIVVLVPPDVVAPQGTLAIVNGRPQDGLSRSLRLGIAAVPPAAHAAVIMLGDQPTVAPALVEQLLDAAHGERPVVATWAEGRLGPPMLLRRDGFELANQAVGDEGLGPILTHRPELVSRVEVAVHPPDVDTPADLAALDRERP